MLSVESLRSGYTGIDVLKGVSLTVGDNAIVGVLGPNGAGKTALLRAISGLNPVRGGHISFAGTEISQASPDAIVRHGVIQVPQGRMLFGSMTVRENLELGAYLQLDDTATKKRLLLVHDLFPALRERSGLEAAYLSGGEQQMLAVARILRTGARLLLLDEISEGLAPVIVQKLGEVVRGLRDQGYTIVMVEQNFRFAAPLADRFLVMEHGQVIQQFTQAELPSRTERLHEYLGV
jgi:branched-chain amino acid transport system ATP-binding protein